MEYAGPNSVLFIVESEFAEQQGVPSFRQGTNWFVLLNNQVIIGCCDCFELHDIVMQHRKEPEVITLSDGDEQESQDLFDSPEEQEVIECIDSDDLFSSPEVVEGNTNGRRISYRSPGLPSAIHLVFH